MKPRPSADAWPTLRMHLKELRAVAGSILFGIRRLGGLRNMAAKAALFYRREGVAGIRRGLYILIDSRKRGPGVFGPEKPGEYARWMRQNEHHGPTRQAQLRERINKFASRPLFSIVLPVFNPPVAFLDKAIMSVRDQLYENWELCIAVDASTDLAVRTTIAAYIACDARIKAASKTTNGHISHASNSAIDVASGNFIVFLDHSDLLSPDALFWIAEAINEVPSAGLIYSDEDRISAANVRSNPNFKCEFNRELLLAHNMFGHLSVYRTALIKALGGLRPEFEGAQDYDLALRVTESLPPEQIVHVPRILYHSRTVPDSTASASIEKNNAVDAGRRAVGEHLLRTGITAKVIPAAEAPAMNRVRFPCPLPHPKVSIIIPTRDRVGLLRMCIESLVSVSTYQNYDVFIVDNGSTEPETAKFLDTLPNDKFTVLRDDSPFNFSALNNRAAAASSGELLCLLNNDIEFLTPDWLEEMVSFAMQADVGCVGARLWYPDGHLQHGGCILGIEGVCGHSHKNIGRGNPGYFGRAVLHQSLSVVTAACLVVRRSVFELVGGLDEGLAVAFNDVDFCLRVRNAGYRNVWTPYAEMNHHESASRGQEDSAEKTARFAGEVKLIKARWGQSLLADPAYNPNLTLQFDNFSYAWPSRVTDAVFSHEKSLSRPDCLP